MGIHRNIFCCFVFYPLGGRRHFQLQCIKRSKIPFHASRITFSAVGLKINQRISPNFFRFPFSFFFFFFVPNAPRVSSFFRFASILPLIRGQQRRNSVIRFRFSNSPSTGLSLGSVNRCCCARPAQPKTLASQQNKRIQRCCDLTLCGLGRLHHPMMMDNTTKKKKKKRETIIDDVDLWNYLQL